MLKIEKYFMVFFMDYLLKINNFMKNVVNV